MIRNCLICKKEFKKAPSRIKIGWGKYCSLKCKYMGSQKFTPWNKNKKGTHFSFKTEFKRGNPPPPHKTDCQCFRCNPDYDRSFLKEKVPWNKGKKDEYTTSKRGKKFPQYSGLNSTNWKGGITPLQRRARSLGLLKTWAKTIKLRDKYQCQICGEIGNKPRANHIKKFSDYPELRFELNNGITICERCDLKWVFFHESEWESYFNFNLMVRRII